MGIHPQIAHTMPAHDILRNVPRLSQSDLFEVRRDFAVYLNTREGQTHSTWQAAWNAYTRATENQPGTLTFTPIRCADCHGRKFNTRHIARNLSRTGQPYVCGSCRGTGRGQRTSLTAYYLPVPAASTTTSDQNQH